MISQSTLSPPFHQYFPLIHSHYSNKNKTKIILHSSIIHGPRTSLTRTKYFLQVSRDNNKNKTKIFLHSSIIHGPRTTFPRTEYFLKILGKEVSGRRPLLSIRNEDFTLTDDIPNARRSLTFPSIYGGAISWLAYAQAGQASEGARIEAVYEIGELFELGIQLSYLLLLLGFLGVGTFFVIRQVLVRRELDLSAKELQEQVRSGDGSGTELFELGAVMLRRKFYPAATKYLLQAIEKWDGDDQDLAQVHNALGVSYVRDEKLEKGIAQFETAVKLQPGYVTAWNNLGDAYEKNKDMKSALRAFEEVLLFDPNNKLAGPRRDALKEKVQMYKGVAVKTKPRKK